METVPKTQQTELEDELEDEKTNETDETVRETVENALAELRDEDASGDENAPKNNDTQPDRDGTNDRAAEKPDDKPDVELRAPERFNAKAKEVFNAAPVELKKEISAMVTNTERQFHRARQEVAKARQESHEIVQAVKPYIAEWGAQGYTTQSALASLAAAHSKLMNPKTRLQTYIDLGKDLNIDLSKMGQPNGQNGQAPVNIDNHPTVQALRNELNEVKSYTNQQQSAEFNARVDSLASEYQAVIDERDAAGQYLYPELHNRAFLQQAKSLVSALAGAVPNMSPADQLRTAWSNLTGRNLPGDSGQINQTKLPNHANRLNNRATSGAVSVRGGSAPTTAGNPMDNMPESALDSPRATAQWALESLRSR